MTLTSVTCVTVCLTSSVWTIWSSATSELPLCCIVLTNISHCFLQFLRTQCGTPLHYVALSYLLPFRSVSLPEFTFPCFAVNTPYVHAYIHTFIYLFFAVHLSFSRSSVFHWCLIGSMFLCRTVFCYVLVSSVCSVPPLQSAAVEHTMRTRMRCCRAALRASSATGLG